MGKPVLGRKPFCRKAESPGIGEPLLVNRGRGWPRLLLVSFMSFSNWEAKQMPPSDKGLMLEIRGNTSEPQG